MMAEYLYENYPPGAYSTHVRLGQPRSTPPGELATAEERAVKLMTLPEADAVVRVGDVVTVIEFIIWRPQETIGQLVYYMMQLTSTPGYLDVKPENVHGKVVTGLEDQRVREFALALGLEFEVYRPAWLVAALSARRGRS
jgi:hypothetical protein